MPPSTDDLPRKKPPERKPRRGGGRRPGKQPGAPGMYLAWHDHHDDTIPHFPVGACAWGADLAGAEDLGVRYSHQVTDLPEARAQTIQRQEARDSAGRPVKAKVAGSTFHDSFPHVPLTRLSRGEGQLPRIPFCAFAVRSTAP